MNILTSFVAVLAALITGMYIQPVMQKPICKPIIADTLFRHTLPPPEIIARTDNSRTKPIILDSLDVQISVVGNIARTTLTMIFRNDNNTVLEGELNVPLDEGQTIRRFAMDVNGNLREGVPVEKQQARVAFESVVRRKTDPGLIELTRGNSFRTRVYPIPAKGVKTVVVGYDQELPAFNDRLQYVLPFVFKKPVAGFTIRAESAGSDAEPKVEEAATGAEFIPENDGFALTVRRTNYVSERPFSFSLPAGESRAFTADQAGTSYFYIFSTTQGQFEKKLSPRSLVLVWDASGSGSKRQIIKELALLDLYFQKITSCEVQTLILRDNIESGRKFSVVGGNSSVLREYLQNQPFDGATNLGSLDLRHYRGDEILLFSDGTGNFGGKEIMLGNAPVYAVNSSPDAEYSYLRYVSQKTGGAFINLLSSENEDALELLTSRQLTLISATSTGATDIVPSVPTPVPAGGIGICGKMNGGTAVITLHYGYGGREEFTETVRISTKENKTDADFIGSLHAAKKIAELDMKYSENKAEITRLGKEFSIVTRNTSLIVLDRVEDYAQHEITPPEELLAAYNRIMTTKKQQKILDDSTRFADVLRLFADRQKWWNEKFPKPMLIDKSEQILRISGDETMNDETMSEQSDALMPTSRSMRASASPMMESRMGRGGMSAMNGRGAVQYNTAESNESDDEIQTTSSISLEAWNPETPYIEKLKSSPKQEQYKTYLALKSEYGGAAGFFLDVADFFYNDGQKDVALRVLSNIAEMELENPQIFRVLGHRLMQLGYTEYAVGIFRDVLEMRGEEPQSYRDLALALAADNKPQEAADLLYHIIVNKWDARFPEIELIVAGELNRLTAKSRNTVKTGKFDKRLLTNMPADIRVVLTWDADNCDMDLWVTDPKGEKCFYGNRDTRWGGHISRDLVGGYGPEEFIMKKAIPGTYTVQVNYYGTTSQKTVGPTTVQVVLFTRYATGREEKKEITMRLNKTREVIDIGKFEFAEN
ncbi:hypothetical protein MASR2M18_08570 [Ignavibacteria bacterium]